MLSTSDSVFHDTDAGLGTIGAGREVTLPTAKLGQKALALRRKEEARHAHEADIEEQVALLTTPQHVSCVLTRTAQICALSGWLHQRRAVRDNLEVATRAVQRTPVFLTLGNFSLLLNMLGQPNLSSESVRVLGNGTHEYSIAEKMLGIVNLFEEMKPDMIQACPALHDMACRLVCCVGSVCASDGPFHNEMRALMFKWGQTKPPVTLTEREAPSLLAVAGERTTRFTSSAYNLGALPAARRFQPTGTY